MTGPVTTKLKEKVLRVYEQTPDPKLVMCVGACGSTGGVFSESYNLHGPLDAIVPVAVYVPGCPPRPEAIIYGVAQALAKLEALQSAS